MEEKNIIDQVNQISKCIQEDELIKKVKESEKVMMNDSEVIILMSNYNKAQDELNNAIRFKLDTKKYQNDLVEAKSKLYSHELVKQYLDDLKKANELLNEVKEKILEGVFVNNTEKKSCE